MTGTATGVAGVSGIENATGGSGNDTLIGNSAINVLSGGNGNDILIGGGGNDTLNGGNDQDLLIGGTGSDLIHGNSSDDILIGGTTVFANETTQTVNLTALDAILAEWQRTDETYSQRVAHLLGTSTGGLNGSYLLNSSTVFNDGSVDTLFGDAGLDWFLASASDTVNKTASETVTTT
jgi:Ca2+-binding RTX toxin-like protein